MTAPFVPHRAGGSLRVDIAHRHRPRPATQHATKIATAHTPASNLGEGQSVGRGVLLRCLAQNVRRDNRQYSHRSGKRLANNFIGRSYIVRNDLFDRIQNQIWQKTDISRGL